MAYIDANEGTTILDIKPYTPSVDKVENPSVPQWCSHWPKCSEESGGFDWEGKVRQGKMGSSWCDYYLYGILKDDYLSKN